MSDDTPSELRRHPRVTVDLPIRLSTIDPEVDPWTGRPFFRSCEETVADVSRGGARVLSDEPLGAGRRILLEMDLPDGRLFEAIARVAWSRLDPGTSTTYGLGLEFLGGTPDHLARLDRFLHGESRGRRAPIP
jgi:PilZ domain-containing protein